MFVSRFGGFFEITFKDHLEMTSPHRLVDVQWLDIDQPLFGGDLKGVLTGSAP